MQKKIILAIVILLVLSLLPCAIRTATWAGDAYGLVILVTLPSDKMTFNPYSRNGYFINQDGAVWALENLDYPYSRCSGLSRKMGVCDISLVSWIGRSLDPEEGQPSGKSYELLRYFIERGEPVNQLTNGLAPVHEAIIFRNPRYLKILLSSGADLGVKLDTPGKPYDGYNAVQFLGFLESEGIKGLDGVRKVIDNYQQNNA